MPTPEGQVRIENVIYWWRNDMLSNSPMAKDTAAWNYFSTQVPDLAARVYELVSTAGYAGGGILNKTGTITKGGPTVTDPVDAFSGFGDFNVSVWSSDSGNPFTGALVLERTFDNGAHWLPVTALSIELDLTGPVSTSFSESEPNVLYRLNCTAFSGGEASWRLSR